MSSISNEELIAKAKLNLEKILYTNGFEKIDKATIGLMMDKLKYDKSLFFDSQQNEPSNTVIFELLPPAINVLKFSGITPLENLDVVVDLIEALLVPKSFAEVLEFIPLYDLVMGIESKQVPSLQAVSVKQVAKALPSDLKKHSDLIPLLLNQLADLETTRPQTFETCFQTLIASTSNDHTEDATLVIAQLFSGVPLATLHKMHDSGDAILIGRLLELLKNVVLLPPSPSLASTNDNINQAKKIAIRLLKFPVSLFDPESWDGLLVGEIIQFYRTILESPNRPNAKDLLDFKTGLGEELEMIANVFSLRDDYIEVRLLVFSDIVGIFGALTRSRDNILSTPSVTPESMSKSSSASSATSATSATSAKSLSQQQLENENSQIETEFFKKLDIKFDIVETASNSFDIEGGEDRRQIMAMISPYYLLKYHRGAVESLEFHQSEIAGLRNVLSCDPGFEYLAPSQSNLMNDLVSYEDRMFVLGGIIKSPKGCAKLLSEWPQVMNNIIHPDYTVSEQDALERRREVLEALLDITPKTALGVWYQGLKDAYRDATFGQEYGSGHSADPRVALANRTM